MIMLKTINSAALQFSQTLPEATLIITLLLLLKRFAYREIVLLIKKKKTIRTSIVHHPLAVGSKAVSSWLCRKFQCQELGWQEKACPSSAFWGLEALVVQERVVQ